MHIAMSFGWESSTLLPFSAAQHIRIHIFHLQDDILIVLITLNIIDYAAADKLWLITEHLMYHR